MEGKSSYTVRRTFSFESAHQLPGHATCGVVHGHGYRGEVMIVARALTEDGFVMDFGLLKSIISPYDHSKILTQTAEQLAEEIGQAALGQLARQDNGKDVIEIRVVLWETPNACAEWVWHVQDQ